MGAPEHTATPAYAVIWAARYSKATNSWDQPRVILHADGSEAALPAISVRPSGDVIAAWRRTDVVPGSASIDSVRMRFSSTAAKAPWTPSDADGPQRVDDPQAPGARVGSLSVSYSPVNQANTFVKLAVVWTSAANGGGGDRVLGRVIRGSDGALVPVTVLSDSLGAGEFDPQVEINFAGIARLAWVRAETNGQSSVWSRDYGFAGWGGSARFSPASHQVVARLSVTTARRGESNADFWISWVERRAFGAQRGDVGWVSRAVDAQLSQLSVADSSRFERRARP